jgi:hypothetical protein
MPTHERLGTHDREDLHDGWKPTIQPDKEQTIVVREPNATVYLTPQNDQTDGGSATFSVSGRLFDLSGATRTASTKHSSAIVALT